MLCTKGNYYKLVNYVRKEYGIKVIEKPNVEVCYVGSINAICIDKNLHNEKKLFLLSHEIGHAVNAINNLEYTLDQQKPGLMSKVNSCQILSNEIMAWETGKKVMKSINIIFDESKYEKVKSNCINTYVLNSVEKIYGCSLNRLNKQRKI